MSSMNECPECTKELSDGVNRCTCGWFNISETKSESPYQCQHRECGVRCKNEGVSSPLVRGNLWYCQKHTSHQKY
jgi:hypothetical protein